MELGTEVLKFVDRCLCISGKFELINRAIIRFQVLLQLVNTLLYLERIIFDLRIGHRLFIVIEDGCFQFLTHLLVEVVQCYQLALVLRHFPIEVILKDF